MLQHGVQSLATRSSRFSGASVRCLRQGLPRSRSDCLNSIQHAATRLRNLTRRALHAATVTVRTGGSSINELIDHIHSDGNVDHTRDSSLLVVLSTGYAKHARDRDLPIRIASRILNGRNPMGRLTSVTAVVDGLSSPNQRTEGLAYLLQSSTDAGDVASAEPLRSSAQRPGSITFAINKAIGQQDWQLQVPLAQTIFSTGLTSTLISRQHELSAEGALETPFSEDYLESLTFNLEGTGRLESVDLDIPLVQLTSYRTVGQSMGNIIRTVSAADTHEEEPASRNLEQAVTAYFEALDASPQPVNVWALIVPKATLLTGKIDALTRGLVLDKLGLQSVWNKSHAGYSDDNRDTMKSLLRNSARLVKVLSGGGGWGKKAGLLSLDPDLEYSTRELRDDFGWQFDFDQTDDGYADAKSVERQIDQALGASVEEGDGIVFFIAPVKAAGATGTNPLTLDSITGKARLNFTVYASSNTADGHSESNVVAAEVNDEVVFVPSLFAIASETGLGLKIRENNNLINMSKLEIPGVQVALTERQTS